MNFSLKKNKLSKYIRLSALASLTSFWFFINPLKVQSESSTKPFIVFVNGNGDCCAGGMTEVKAIAKQLRGEVWTTSYASFKDRSVTNRDPATGLSTDLDKKFITEATQKLNSIPESRPVVLIGHSFGGDSILKILPRINRRIQLVVTIDPVGSGGLRSVAKTRKVPSNVDYFLNRWQENGLTASNAVPFDSRINGSISCDAKVCDQDSQNLARNSDYSPIKVSCGAQEVTCEGWRLPGCNFGGCWKGSNGTKSKRMFHNDMPRDGYIQQIVGEKMKSQLTAELPDNSTARIASQNKFSDMVDVPVSQLDNPNSFDSRFRAVHNWAAKNDYAAGFPNFHQANTSKGTVYGTILLKLGAADVKDISATELGNPSNNEDRFRAVHNWAAKNGYAAGFPNFHQAKYSNGVVYGATLLKLGTVDVRDVPASQLGNPSNNEDRFRAMHNWAAKNGYVTGFPNFHQADYGNGVVYGTILIKK